MTFIQIALTIILSLNLLWWVWAHYHARHTARPRFWRIFTAVFVLTQLACLVWLFYARGLGLYMPLPLRSISYIWNGVAAPLAVLIACTITLASTALLVLNLLRRSFARRETPASAQPTATSPRDTSGPTPDPANLLLSRRTIITAAIAAPPVLTGLALTKALWQLDSFRVREINVAIPNLHRSLDGVTIAHVTDTHVGRYTTGPLLREIASRVNSLNCDLVLCTGDLIDSSHDDLPEAIRMLHAIDKPIYMCEGNHDLFGGRENFEKFIKDANVPLLLDDAADITINGHPLQIMGIRWGSTMPGANRRDAYFIENTSAVAKLRRPEAFPILLAHHPHAFDAAAQHDIPLTLAGHTHGGQLMLTDSIGAGPSLYKYWSGRYEKRDGDKLAQCVVGNGTGNWFPLRINAPAEIIKITLRPA